jgi:hypothetical protein
MSDQDPARQPDPLLRNRIGSRWIVVFSVVVVILLVALLYGLSQGPPNGKQTAGMSSDQTPRSASGTTHQDVPQSGDRGSSTGAAGGSNAPPSRIEPTNHVHNGTQAPSKP